MAKVTVRKSKAAVSPVEVAEARAEDVRYDRIREHIGHQVEVVCYGKEGTAPANVAVECLTCQAVVVDATHRDWRAEGR